MFAILLPNILAFAKDKRDENSPPDLTNWLVSPNGGESFAVGSSIAVTINGALYTPPTVVVELFKGATRVWGPSYAGITGRTIPTAGLANGSDYRVHIYNASVPTEEDYSNGYFTISTVPSLANWIVSPNGGESYPVGATIPVSINNALYNAGGAGIVIELFKGATKVWGPSIAGISGRTIPTTGLAAGSDYRVHIYNANNSTEEDYSNGNFSIVAPPPSLTNWIISPNGGESFASGASIPVSIDGTLYTPPTVVVELYKGTTRVWGPIYSGISGRTFSTVGLSAGSDYRVRIYNASNPAEEDYSNSYFSISSSDINNWIISPNGGESFTYGSIIPIDLRGYGANQAVGVDLYKGSVRVGGDGTGGNTGRKIVTSGMTLTAGTDYKVRVYLANNPSQEDWSNNFFTIVGSGTGGGGSGGGSGRPGPTTTGVIGCAAGTYTLRVSSGYMGATPTGFKWFTSQFGSTELSNTVIDNSSYSGVSGSYTGYFSSSTTYWVATIFENNTSNLSQRNPVSFIIDPTSTSCPPPWTPVALPATLVSGSCFTANWQASSGATSYRLDVSSDNFNTFVNGIRDVTVNGTSVSIGSLGAGNYQYRVKAVNSGGTSLYSTPFSFVVACAGTPESRFINFDKFADYSNSACGSGTKITASIVAGDNTILTPSSDNNPNPKGDKYYVDFGTNQYEPNNGQPAIVKVKWKQPYKTGYIKIKVEQERYRWSGLDPCANQGKEYLYDYHVYHINCSTCRSGLPISANIFNSDSQTACEKQFWLVAKYGDANCAPIESVWNFGDGTGTITSTTHNVTHRFPDNDTREEYTVTVTFKSKCNNLASITQTTVSTIVKIRKTKLSFDFQNSICGTSFIPSPIYPSTNCKSTAYEWDFGDGTKSTLPSPFHAYANADTYNVSLKLTYSCGSCEKIITETRQVNVPAKPPIAGFNYQNNACTTMFQPEFYLADLGCIKTYLWNFGDGTTSTDSNPSHFYSKAGTFNVSLSLTYQCSNVCTNQVISTTVTKTVTLAPAPTATADFTGNNYYCGLRFFPTANYGANTCKSISYYWDFGDGFKSTDRSPIHVYANAGNYNVLLKLIYQCTGSCPAEITTTKQINFSPIPFTTTFENLLITSETDQKDMVINASAATFSDSWSLPHDNIDLSNRSSYFNGTQGVWRNNASYVYKTLRQLSANTDLTTDGTYTLNQFDWGSAEFNVVPNWIQANTMTQYSPYSYELENKDVLGVYSAALYDYGGHLPSANGVNMRNAEMAFTSFEVSDGKPSGNWMLNNTLTPSSTTYSVLIAQDFALVVDAPLEEFDFVSKVDVNAEAFWFSPLYLSLTKPTAYLQDVDILCKQVHPTNPNQSILVLQRAPFIGFWSGSITLKKTVSPQADATLDHTIAHTGKSSLKVSTDLTLQQKLLELEAGKSYWVNVWVRVENVNLPTPKLADELGIEFTFKDKQNQIVSTASFQPVGTIIEGWQQVRGIFKSPIKNPLIEIKFKRGSSGTAWYDDLRLQPENGNMKAYVYDLNDYRLMAILDEENFASFFYYDVEGNLYLTKKETERGIKTITENVSYQVEKK